MFTFPTERRSRKPSLTPMIDVVFLLLVFFMLAARFGQDVVIPLSTSGAETEYSGPPRLVSISETGLRLNGVMIASEDLVARLAPLMAQPEDTIFLQTEGETALQSLVTVIDTLTAAGFSSVVLVPLR